MTAFIQLVFNFILDFCTQLGSYTIELFEIKVPILDIFITITLFSIIFNVFWKGAKA